MFLIIPHSLANVEIQNYYQNESWFNGVFSRDKLPNKIKNEVHVINLDEFEDTVTHWVVLFCTKIEVIYFDSFGVGHVPKEIEKFIGYKNIKTNIFRVQLNNSIMCVFFCTGFIDFMFAGKSLIDYDETCFVLLILKKMKV